MYDMNQPFWNFVQENQVQNPPIGWYHNLYHNHSVQYKSQEELEAAYDKLSPLDFNNYFWNIVGNTQLSQILINLEFNGKGIMHYGGWWRSVRQWEPKKSIFPLF